MNTFIEWLYSRREQVETDLDHAIMGKDLGKVEYAKGYYDAVIDNINRAQYMRRDD